MQPIDPALLSDGSSTDPEDEEEDELDGLITIEKESAQGKELRLRTVAKALFDEIDQDDSGVSCPYGSIKRDRASIRSLTGGCVCAPGAR